MEGWAHSSSWINALPQAVLLVDAPGVVRFANPAAEALFETSAAQLQGKSLNAIAPEDKILLALLERCAASAQAIREYEHTLLLPRRHEIKVSVQIVPVAAEGDGEGGFMLLFDPPAAREALTAQAIHREVLRAAGTMAAMLAHEVKNPLAGIRGAAQLLGEEVGPDQAALPELICREVDRARGVIDQFEFFADALQMEKEAVNIHEVLQYVVNVAGNSFARGVRFEQAYDPSLPEVSGKRDWLVQVLLNLVKNAGEALAEAGTAQPFIKLSTSYRSGLKLRDAAGRSISAPVTVTVEDNGPGVAEAMRGQLFEPFASGREGGRGLGLAIVAKILADLGGAVELESTQGGRTRFRVMLPVAS